MRKMLSRKQFMPNSFEEFLGNEYDLNSGVLSSYENDDYQDEKNYSNNRCRIHPLSLFTLLWYSFYRTWIVLYTIVLPIVLSFPDLQVIYHLT